MIRPTFFPATGRQGHSIRAGGSSRTARARAGGFTLIELMIVVVITMILAAVAYPAYTNYVVRSYRSEGQQWLQDFAQIQEQLFLDRRAYATGGAPAPGGARSAAIPLPLAFPGPGTSADQRYNAPTVTAVAGPPPGYIACLQPRANGPVATAKDGGLCIDSTGLRWRDMNTNGTFDAGVDLLWSDR